MLNPAKVPKSTQTRERLLDAGEALFANKGFDGTTIQQIARAAGLSNAAPIFFFGSKRGLYQAVLERSFSKVRETIEEYAASAPSPATLKERLTEAVQSYTDIVASRTTFARLVEWENLAAGERLGGSPPHVAAMQAALAALDAEVKRGTVRRVNAEQLLISMLALCWFPVTHRVPLLRGLGHDPDDPTFIQQRVAHVVDLVLYGLLPREVPHRRAPRKRGERSTQAGRQGS